jgi:hypothetical protein
MQKSDPLSEADLKSLLAGIRQNRSAQADFQEQRVIRLMKNPIISSGRVWFQPPNKFRREAIAAKLSKAGWSLGWVSAVDSKGRTIWIVDAHRDDGKRFVVRADEKLAAFLELELAIRVPANLGY